MKRKLFWAGLFVLSLLLNLAARIWCGFAEWYAVHIYPLWVGTLGRVCSMVPFSVVEVGIYLAVLLLAAGIVAVILRKLSPVRAAGILLRVIIAGFFLFTLNCGINYQRTTFSERAGFQIQEFTEEELVDLCEFLVGEINEAAQEIDLDKDGHYLLAENPAKEARLAMQAAAQEYPELGGYYPKAKPVFSTWYLSWQLLQGVYSPFTVEANYNRGMPDVDIPSTICHELSHLKGFMREDEANFIAYLACRASDSAGFRYSGSVLAFIYSGNALYAQDTEAYRLVWSGLCDQAVADLMDHNTYWAAYRGTVAEISDKMNDAYLKANSQSDGTQSYGRMVDLLLEWRRTEG